MKPLDQPLLAASAASATTAAAGTARLSPKPFNGVCFSAAPPPWPVKFTGGNADLIPPPAPEADKAAPPEALPPEDDPGITQKPESKSATWPALAWIILGWTATGLWLPLMGLLTSLEWIQPESLGDLILYGVLIVGSPWIITGLAIRKRYGLTRRRIILWILIAIGIGILTIPLGLQVFNGEFSGIWATWSGGLVALVGGFILMRPAHLKIGQIIGLTIGWTVPMVVLSILAPGIIYIVAMMMIGGDPPPPDSAVGLPSWLSYSVMVFLWLFFKGLVGLIGGSIMIAILESARKREAARQQAARMVTLQY
jgi:hypothetical protein